MRPVILAGAAALAAVAGRPAAAEEPAWTQGARITLSAPAGLDASGVVEGGIPLPEGIGVKEVSDLALFLRRCDAPGGWVPVPVQWSVLSRWRGPVGDVAKPVRWVFARFRGDAGGEYRLRWGPGLGTAAAGAPVAREEGDAIAVDTGTLRFRVPKERFAPLAGLRVLARDAAGAAVETPVLAEGGADVTLVSVEQDDPASAATVDRTWSLRDVRPTSVTIEENGPLRAVVKVQAVFGEGGALLGGWIRCTMRVVADAGADSVRVLFTLQNDGLYGPPAEPSIVGSEPKWLRIRSLVVDVPTRLEDRITATTADGRFELRPWPGGPDFRLLQTHSVKARDDESRNFAYVVSVGDTGRDAAVECARGARTDGDVAFCDGSRAVTASVRHFWQNHPKATSFAGGALRLELWPREPGCKWPADLEAKWGDAYQFEGGRHKTYEVLLGFGGPAAASQSALARRSAVFRCPPALVVDPAWIADSRAIVPFVPPPFGTGNPGLDEAQRRHAKMLFSFVDVAYAEAQGAGGELPPVSIPTLRESRGNPFPAVNYDLDCYGWMNFGDLPHHAGYCSGHFDWAGGLLRNWLRFGKREFLDVGVEMLRHRYDVDQYHGAEQTDPNWRWFNGFQRFDAGRHGARATPEWTAEPSSTYLQGLLLAYALTGDRRAMEAARENADAFVNYYTAGGALDAGVGQPAEYYGQVTAMAQAVSNLLAFAAFTGERRYYDVAWAVFEKGLLFDEEYDGNDGFFRVRENLRSTWPLVRLVPTLVMVHEMTGDDRALALLLRCLAWLRDVGYRGTGSLSDGGLYLPLQLPYRWTAPKEAPGERVVDHWSIPYDLITADGYAYAYLVTGEATYLEFARRLYRDGILFFQAPEHRSVPAGFRSPVTYSPRQYPNSETKPNAWALNGHWWYLAAEYLRQGGGPPPVTLPDDSFFRARDAVAAPPERVR